jgi:hypothetical protein
MTCPRTIPLLLWCYVCGSPFQDGVAFSVSDGLGRHLLCSECVYGQHPAVPPSLYLIQGDAK